MTSVLAMISFFSFDPKSKATEAKNTKAGLHQTKNLWNSKENCQQNEKTNYGTGENICKSDI